MQKIHADVKILNILMSYVLLSSFMSFTQKLRMHKKQKTSCCPYIIETIQLNSE